MHLVELPQRTSVHARADRDHRVEPERSPGSIPAGVGGRFDRELRRAAREQTSLLSWLAESDHTSPLRDAVAPSDDPPAPEIDLRPAGSIDLRGELSLDELIELAGDDSAPRNTNA